MTFFSTTAPVCWKNYLRPIPTFSIAVAIRPLRAGGSQRCPGSVAMAAIGLVWAIRRQRRWIFDNPRRTHAILTNRSNYEFPRASFQPVAFALFDDLLMFRLACSARFLASFPCVDQSIAIRCIACLRRANRQGSGNQCR